jgi:hypothetical protein
MKIRLSVLAAIGLLVVGVIVVACGGSPAQPTEPETRASPVPQPTNETAPTNTAVPPVPTDVPPTDIPEPTALPSAENCITCHTDEKVLQAMAVEEEVVSSETSGEG